MGLNNTCAYAMALTADAAHTHATLHARFLVALEREQFSVYESRQCTVSCGPAHCMRSFATDQ
jgi:hypothetical protein